MACAGKGRVSHWRTTGWACDLEAEPGGCLSRGRAAVASGQAPPQGSPSHGPLRSFDGRTAHQPDDRVSSDKLLPRRFMAKPGRFLYLALRRGVLCQCVRNAVGNYLEMSSTATSNTLCTVALLECALPPPHSGSQNKRLSAAMRAPTPMPRRTLRDLRSARRAPCWSAQAMNRQ